MSEFDLLIQLIERLGLNDYRDLILESSGTKFSGGHLIWLDLGCKELEEIPEDIFQDFPHLEYIGLYGNSLKKLPEKVFQNLQKLHFLDLGENDIKELKPGQFSANREMEYLWLYGNSLRKLPKEIFSGLTRLKELNLNSNKLDEFPISLVEGLTSLQRLELSLNNFQEIDAELFRSHLPSLKALVFNVVENGVMRIVNLLANPPRKEEGEHEHIFILVTGSMGSGKSTIMSNVSIEKVAPKMPPIHDNILYDNIFAIKIGERIYNFFEIDGPTISTWISFIKVSKLVLLIVNPHAEEQQLKKIRNLIQHVRKNMEEGSTLVIVLNRYSGESPREDFQRIFPDIDFSDIEILATPLGKATPYVGGLQRVVFNQEDIDAVFKRVLEILEE